METLKKYSAFIVLILAVNAGISAGSAALSSSASAGAGMAAVSAALGTPAALAAFCHTFKKNIQIGDAGAEVKSLQAALELAHITVTGSERIGSRFGQATLAAAKRFQEKNALPQSGFVGPQTRAKLNALFACATPAPIPTDRKAEAVALPSDALVSGKNILYREKITGIALRGTLGKETFSIKSAGASFSGYQLFAYNTKDFSGTSRFFSPQSSSATTTIFDLSSIALSKGQYAYLQLAANASVTANDAFITVSRASISDATLLGGLNPGKLWQIGLTFPSRVYQGTDFSINAAFSNTSGVGSLEAFTPELIITDAAGRIVYDYVQPNSGMVPLPANAQDEMVFGTVSGGEALQKMNFPAGHYFATLTFYDPARPAYSLGKASSEFDVTILPPVPNVPGAAIVATTSAADALDSGSASALLSDFSNSALEYQQENGKFGPATSSCDTGIFADPLTLDTMANILQADGATVICRANPVSFALSIQFSPDAAPVCVDSLGYAGDGKVDTVNQTIAYCLRGSGKFDPN